MMSKLPARRPIIKWNNLCGFHYELPPWILPKAMRIIETDVAIHANFSPSALVGGVRGRVSELAGGVDKIKHPPQVLWHLHPPLKAGGFGGAAGRCRRHFFPLAFASFAFLILAAIHAGIGTAFADE